MFVSDRRWSQLGWPCSTRAVVCCVGPAGSAWRAVGHRQRVPPGPAGRLHDPWWPRRRPGWCLRDWTWWSGVVERQLRQAGRRVVDEFKQRHHDQQRTQHRSVNHHHHHNTYSWRMEPILCRTHTGARQTHRCGHRGHDRNGVPVSMTVYSAPKGECDRLP